MMTNDSAVSGYSVTSDSGGPVDEDGEPTRSSASASNANKRRRQRTRRLWLARAILLATVLGVWEYGSGRFLDPFFFSSPSDAWSQLADWIDTGILWHHLWVTVQESASGFMIGAAAGILLGLIAGLFPFIADTIDPIVVALYGLPKVALVPLFIIWFGLDKAPKIALSAIIVFFLVFYSTLSGTRQVNRDLVDVMRVLGANPFHILRKVTIPSALTQIFTGLHISIPYAIVGAVTGELLASNAGMGFLIQTAASAFDIAGVFAGLFVLMLLTSVLNYGLERVERYFFKWKPSTRTETTAIL